MGSVNNGIDLNYNNKIKQLSLLKHISVSIILVGFNSISDILFLKAFN